MAYCDKIVRGLRQMGHKEDTAVMYNAAGRSYKNRRRRFRLLLSRARREAASRKKTKSKGTTHASTKARTSHQESFTDDSDDDCVIVYEFHSRNVTCTSGTFVVKDEDSEVKLETIPEQQLVSASVSAALLCD